MSIVTVTRRPARSPEAGAETSPGWLDWGGDGPYLHFAHANGFPPATYRALLEPLARLNHVVSAEARPLRAASGTAGIDAWTPLAHDLRDALTARGLRGIVGVGHSLGAVTSLLAAADDPGLFSAVVAIDPVLITGIRSLAWGLAKRLGLAGRLGLVRGALARRERWPDQRTARRAYAAKRVFRHWRSEVLDDYVDAGFAALPEGGVALRYPKHWEARIFQVAPHDEWRRLNGLRVPTLFIQGERSDTFLDAARERAVRGIPGARAVVIPGVGHFAPMEAPDRIAGVVMEFLGDLRGRKGGSGEPGA